MAHGVVLGWSPALAGFLDRVDVARYDLTLVVTDRAVLGDLADRDIEVVTADPTSVSLEELGPAEVALVGDPDPDRALTILTRVRTAWRPVHAVAYASPDAPAAATEALREAADQLLDHTQDGASAVLQAASSAAAVRAFRVRDILHGIDGPVCVFTHNNPDPDAIASAVGVVRLAEHLGVSATANYYGEITHQSNRAFINALDLSLTQIDRGEVAAGCDGIVLVDHAISGRNNAVADDRSVDLVFDHHRSTGPVEGKYVDIRESVGATSSILVEYLQQFGIRIDETLATALLYGISTDTRNFSRQVTALDFNAAATLWETANHQLIERIDDPGVSRRTLQTIGKAISNRVERGPSLAAYVGTITEKDAISQATDLLVQLDTVSIALVYGLEAGTVYASARARGAPRGFDLSMVMRDAFDQIGSAGGHEEMAGAQIPLGFLSAEVDENDDARAEIIRDVIEDRWFEAVRASLRGAAPD